MAVLQKIFFRLRFQFALWPLLRKLRWQMLGARFGAGTAVPRLDMTWPHQVSVGRGCVLEDDVFFKYAHSWQPGPSLIIQDNVFIGKGCEFNIRRRIEVGRDCLVASGCKFIDHDHEMAVGDLPMNKQPCPDGEIILGDDVWLGVNVVVLKGVTIGRGAVVGAGAVVTKSIPSYEIWAGIPARRIGERQSAEGPRAV